MIKHSLINALPKPIAALAYKIYFKNKFLGMTSSEEQKLYEKYTIEFINKDGAIVDLGCWMGSTSNSLASGIKPLNAETIDKNQIYAFDQFIWEEWMDAYLPLVSKPYKPGDIFEEEAIIRTAPFKSVIQVERVDLTKFIWPGEPIKILLVDAMKNKELTIQISRTFFPALEKGSIVLHQDFKHYYTPWIHILQYNLKEHFEIVEDVKYGGTTVFKLIKRIPEDLARSASTFDNLDNAFIEDVFSYSKSVVKMDVGRSIDASKVMYYVHTRQAEKARSVFNDLKGYSGITGELKAVARHIGLLEGK